MYKKSVPRTPHHHAAPGSILAGNIVALIASISIASEPGLPFTEQFVDTDQRDAAITTADWGNIVPGQLGLGSEESELSF